MRGRAFSLAAVGFASALGATSGHAQVAGSEPIGEIEEIEVKGHFISRGAASATKLPIGELDTPQSVTSYTNSFMKAIETREVADLYRYMTGIQRAGNTGYDLTIRGFKTQSTDRNSIMVDGLPGLTVRFGSPPTVGTDHIEVVKGPSSILYGQEQPGGFVNIISKKPSADPGATFEAIGTDGLNNVRDYSGYDFSADLTGPVLGHDNVLYRLIGEVADVGTYRNGGYERPVYLAPSVSYLLDDATKITVQTEYRKTKTSYDTYMVAPANQAALAPTINTRYQTDSDYLREEGATASLFVNHDFGGGLKWNFGFRDVYHRDVAVGYDVVAILPDLNEVSLRARNQLNIRTYKFGDTNLTDEFKTGPISHTLIVGANLGEETLDADRRQFFNIPTTPSTVAGPHAGALNIYNPKYNNTILPLYQYPLFNPATPANLNDRYTDSNSGGVYISDLMSLAEQWKAMFGLRYAREKSQQRDLRILTTPIVTSDNDAVLPMVGLIFEPTNKISLYSTYSESMVPAPATAQDIHGLNNFVPTTANSIEAGAKAVLWDRRVNATAAWFRIDKQNVISTFTGGTCPTSIGTCSQQVGEERSTGVEVEVDANPLPNWQIAFGYSYIDGTVVKSSIVPQVGAALTNVPKNNLHVWNRYDIEEGPLSGLGAGLGVVYISERTGLLPTATVADTLKLPSYALADIALYYVFNNIELTFKVSNVFDKRYIESVGFSGNINVLPGAPRTALLSARVSF